MKRVKVSKRGIWSAVLLIGGNVLFFFTVWLLSKYDQIQLDQVIFQMKTPAAGANRDLMTSAFLRVGVFSALLTVLELFLYLTFTGRLPRLFKRFQNYGAICAGKVGRCFKKGALPFSAAMLAFSLLFFIFKLNVPSYVEALFKESDFIKDHYADPTQTTVTFPEEKRNLIYIFLESMENTYAEPEAGGQITQNFIPELTELAKENTFFSNDEGIGGALSFPGSTWTAAAMVAQTSGMVVKVPLTADTYGGEDRFIPGIVSIGQLLEQQGYRQTLLLGSDAAFAGRNSYFTEHGNYQIIDINSLKKEGRLPADYLEWWGYEDEKLFAFAKEELTKLGASGKPFNFTMLTADTHFPNGYLCPSCGTEHKEQYANVLACSSKKVLEFVRWIQAQPFYENTTVIISGDHLTMDPKFLEGTEEDYTRTIYNCFINAAAEPQKTQNRRFATFDMFPTTLAAMGATIEGDRLGMGTNLFSGKKTLLEQYGYEYLSKEMNRKSVFYNRELLQMSNVIEKNEVS